MPYKSRYCYRVYGLILAANIEIPGLAAEKVESQESDIAINMGFLPDDVQSLVAVPSEEYYLEPGYAEGDPPHLVVNKLADEEYFHLSYETGVQFVCDQNAEVVWGIWDTSLQLEDAALYLLGPVIGFMLRLRGITCLHASGAVVNGAAFALTGPSGAGKSTLAASFAAAGYPVLSDDVLPLGMGNGVIVAHPGYSRLRVYPNTFENSPELPDSLPLLSPRWDKCYLDLSAGSYQLHGEPATLKVIYIIDWSDGAASVPSVVDISGIDAVPLLAANTYRNELLSPEMRMAEFDFLSHLCALVKVKKIKPVDDILRVPELRKMLLEDFQKETAGRESRR